MEREKLIRLAVLIDADNAQSSLVESLFTEIARYGEASVRRAYGDWTTQNLVGWKSELHRLAIQPIQQFRYTTGKNATDSALIIDAMDLLHSGKFDGFCIVSSDSDFTRLATRIREAGAMVFGFGEEKTPAPFVAACNKFVYTSILATDESQTGEGAAAMKKRPSLKPLLLAAIDSVAGDDGWAHLGALGSILVKKDPSFDERGYGHKKLSDLVRAQKYIEIREEKVGDSPSAVLSVRVKA
jgi:hypothetical protein